MNKLLVIGGAVVGAALLANRFGLKMGAVDWEKRIAAMPDTAPPKWMFANISAIRENTERILQLLEERAPAASAEPGPPAPQQEPRP